jgi:hypothetical protein
MSRAARLKSVAASLLGWFLPPGCRPIRQTAVERQTESTTMTIERPPLNTPITDAARVLDDLAAGMVPDRARLIAAALALDTLVRTTNAGRDLQDAAAGLQIWATGGTLDLDEAGRPIEVPFAGRWSAAFGTFCAHVADRLPAILASPECVVGVANAIIAATAPLIDDFEVARRAARAAIEAIVSSIAGAGRTGSGPGRGWRATPDG